MKFNKFTETDAPFPVGEVNLKKILSNEFNFGYTNLIKTGIFKIHGWSVDFRDELKHYVVKTDYTLEEMYHLNKTDLRKQVTGVGKVHYIKEI